MTKQELKEKYDTQEHCYANTAQSRNDCCLYWKDAGGIPIIDSENDENIGTRDTYATIQITDMAGSDGYKEDQHIFQFAVFLYVKNDESGFDMFNNIFDAIKDYEKTCEKVKNILQTTK